MLYTLSFIVLNDINVCIIALGFVKHGRVYYKMFGRTGVI